MSTKAAAALCAAAIGALTGCGVPTSGCVVRHQYAIVVFQNDPGANAKSYVMRFRLNIRYGPRDVMHWLMRSDIGLPVRAGGNPPIVVRTYPVGRARSCSVDRVVEHR